MAPKHQQNCKCWAVAAKVHPNAARIPWLPERPTSKTPFCRSAFYKNFIVNASSSQEIILKKNSALYTWDVAFPEYLPHRYHSMDSAEIQKRSKKTGHYFFNAIHFLQKTADLATLSYYNLLKGRLIEENRESELKNIFSKIKPDVCGTPAEFLLEPWVLIQMPFQPALLHQWAVAALAETLRFCKRLVEIGTRGYAPQFHILYMKLAKLSQTLARNCNTLLSYFFNIQCKEPTETVHIKLYKMRNFYELLAEALTMLEFVLGTECTNVIDSIKGSSWGGEFSPEDLVVSADLSEIGLSDAELGRMGLLNIYSLTYWTHHHPHTELCLSKQAFKKIRKDSSDISSLKADEKPTLQLATDICSSLKEFAGKEEFLAGLKVNLSQDSYEILLHETKQFCKWKETSSSTAHFEYGLGAIINDILSLQSDVLVEKALGKVTRQIWLAAKKFDKDVHLKAEVSSLEEQLLSIQEALDKITSVTNCHESWTTQGIVYKTEATCKLDDTLKLSTETEADIAVGHISNQTRALVLKNFAKQYTALPGFTPNVPRDSPFKHYPDCMVMQYIFPCFTAMYQELFGKAGCNVETKTKYLVFLVDLLVGCERQTHTEELGSCKKQLFHETNIFHSSVATLFIEISSVLKFAFKDHVTSETRDTLIRFLGLRRPSEETHKETVSDFYLQLYRLLRRMKNSLHNAGIWQEETAGEALVVRELLPIFITFKQKVTISDKILFLQFLKNTPRGFHAEFIKLCRFVKTTNDISVKIKNDSLKLTLPQLYAISLYEAWSHQQQTSESEFFSLYQGPLFVLECEANVAEKIVRKDWWRLKRIIRFQNSQGDHSEDITLIPMEVAKNNLCCKPLIKALTASNKVPMVEPGQVTFFPIKHCRWCGAVYANQFRLCAECQDEPLYPHRNYFCSKKCEKVAMEKFHTEEHARFIIEELGI